MKRDLDIVGLWDADLILPAAMKPGAPRRWYFSWALVWLWGLTFLLIVVIPAQLAGPPWPRDQPEEGFYWAAAQYEIRLGRLREQLLMIAEADDGSAPTRSAFAEVHEGADSLESRANLLIEPSHLQILMRSLTGYEDAAPAIKALQLTLRIDMQKPTMSAEEARSLVAEIDRVTPTVIRLSDAARERELQGRSELRDTLKRKQDERTVYIAIIWLLLCTTATWFLRARQRDRYQAQQLEQALEAEQLARSLLRDEIAAKGQFASMVNHELRSPLQVVVSSISLLAQELMPTERRNAVARLQRATQMMETQLSDLAVLARGGQEPLKLEPVSFEACALVEDVANVQRPSALKKGLRFHVEVPDEPVFVVADAQRISQILTNLITNAIRCTGGGSVQVQLRVSQVEASCLEIVVADTGPGLPDVQRQRLLGKRTEDQETPGPRREGSGLGLTIVHTVVANLGGTLRVQAPRGFGTRITVSIPVEFEDVDEVPGRSQA